MKIAAGIIVFSSDFVLKQVLDSIYPFMNQILVSEGCVKYWADKGYISSFDKTNEILKNYPDPNNKIIVVHGTYTEKTEQANAYMGLVAPDTDYVWNIDADEIFKPEDIKTIISLLEKEKYTSVGFKSYSFFGGFENYLTGFEQEHEFIRIQKYHPGAMWQDHRPPTIALPIEVEKKHLSYNTLADMGIFMYHYSYVFPRQVATKIQYYEDAVIKKGSCIPNYFNKVYFAWLIGDEKDRFHIEKENKGVHEFIPSARGDCYTKPFKGTHPQVIQNDMPLLKAELQKQIDNYKSLI